MYSTLQFHTGIRFKRQPIQATKDTDKALNLLLFIECEQNLVLIEYIKPQTFENTHGPGLYGSC